MQIVHAGDRLAGAAMGDDAGEALAALVEGAELRARPIVDLDGDLGRRLGREVILQARLRRLH